jgi:peptide/nickel transport system substrate-binding protein
MQKKTKTWTAVTILVVVAAVAIGLVVSSSGKNNPTSGVANKTLTIAEGANAAPDYILPFYPPAKCTVTNTSQFQVMMFRPLYWFGLAGDAGLQANLSSGNLPTYSNKNRTVTLTTKGWKFADGQTVNGQSVLFFLNMYKAEPSEFCTYSKGLGIPDQVKNVSVSDNTVTIDLTASVNPQWFTDNQLANITPMPSSWDRNGSATNVGCATGTYGAALTIADCKKVWTYLNAQAQIVSTFSKTMWQGGVDGPWKLTAMDDLGNATFTANTLYSGPQKPMIKTVKLVAFTSAVAEQNQLAGGNIDLGYVDPSVLTQPAPAPGKAGPNWPQLNGKYKLVVVPTFSNNYMNLNFGKNPGVKYLNQLYIRQALQLGIDQPAIIKNALKNYGQPTWSELPPSTPSTESGTITQPYPFNLAKAASLLKSHGWTKSGSSLVCAQPGTGTSNCGAGIAAGDQLKLNVEWYSGDPSLDTEMSAIIADWTTLGIQLTHSTGTFAATAGSCPSAYNPTTTFDICNWGGGWLYAPDYFPSGEPLLLTGAGSNSGQYSNATMDTLIRATLVQNVKLTTYAQYTADQLPVLYDPLATFQDEVIKGLKSTIGFQSVLQNYTPEYYSFAK